MISFCLPEKIDLVNRVKFIVSTKTLSNSAISSSEDIAYWLTQTKEQSLLGFQNAKQIWPLWIILHPDLENDGKDLQTLYVFEDDSDKEIIEQIKLAIKTLKAYAVFHVYPSQNKENHLFITFISESFHFKKEETFSIRTDNLQLQLGELIQTNTCLMPYLFDRDKEDLC